MAKKAKKVTKNKAFAEAVGARLARAREARNMSQVDLAALLPTVSPQKLWNWENGVALVPPSMSGVIFSVLGIDANYLYQDVQYTSAPEVVRSMNQREGGRSGKRPPSPYGRSRRG